MSREATLKQPGKGKAGSFLAAAPGIENRLKRRE